MINIKTLTPDDIGKAVTYKPNYGEKNTGIISSWNDKYIFVVYGHDKNWQEFYGQATSPEDLTDGK